MDQPDQTTPNDRPWERSDAPDANPASAHSQQASPTREAFQDAVLPRLVDGIDLQSLAGFVDLLLHDTERADPSKNWCEQWWRHPEAITIFHAIQGSMIKAEKDPNIWILHDLAPQLSYLFSDEGPFRSCKPGHHKYKNTPYEGDPTAWSPYRVTVTNT